MPRGVRRDDLHAPTTAPTGAASLSELGSSSKSDTSVPLAKKRQRFGQQEDFLLMLQVKLDAPYKARHGAIQRTWDGVAERLNAHPDFDMRPVKGSTAKARFDTLLNRHREWMEQARARAEMLSDEEQAEGGEGEEQEGTGEMREKRRRMDQRDGPVRALLTEVIEQIDEMQLKVEDHTQALSRGANRDAEEEVEGGGGDAGRGYGQPQKRVYEEYEEEEEEDNGDDAMASRRLAKRRASSSGDRPPVDQEQWLMRRDVDGAQVSRMHVDSLPRVHDILGRSDVVSEEQSAAPSSPDGLDTGDLTTVQQAMGELLKMQHAFAMNLSGGGGGGLMAELEKMNEARLREEEEKTKQRDLELLIERQRTKRRQIELEFERMERQKDREEQAKLIASIVERLQPPIKD